MIDVKSIYLSDKIVEIRLILCGGSIDKYQSNIPGLKCTYRVNFCNVNNTSEAFQCVTATFSNL